MVCRDKPYFTTHLDKLDERLDERCPKFLRRYENIGMWNLKFEFRRKKFETNPNKSVVLDLKSYRYKIYRAHIRNSTEFQPIDVAVQKFCYTFNQKSCVCKKNSIENRKNLTRYGINLTKSRKNLVGTRKISPVQDFSYRA